jgi:hypothetical protein
VAEKMDIDRDVHIEFDLKQGDYIIYIEVEWNSGKSKELVLSSYTD